MNYIVSVEGQSIPVPEEIGASDESVKRALTPFYPEVANALITRVTQSDTVTINVVKKAGSKGAFDPFTALRASPGGQNPAVALAAELRAHDQADELDAYALLEMDERIDGALEAGERQAEHVKAALRRLQGAAARPAGALVMGF